jgi:hypothetical protein
VAPSSSRALQPFGIVAIAGAALALIGSFLDVFPNTSAWSSDGSLPAITLPAILAVVCAVLVALDQLGTLDGATVLLGVPLRRWARALGIDAGALMLCYLIGDAGFSVHGVGGSPDKKIGFWLMLLGALATGVAVVMGPRLQFPTAASTPKSTPD